MTEYKAWCRWCGIRITWNRTHRKWCARPSKNILSRIRIDLCALEPGGRWHDPDPDKP